MSPIPIKTKPELDVLTKEQLFDFRAKFISTEYSKTSDSERIKELHQYVNELELYVHLRFPEVHNTWFDRQAKDMAENKFDEREVNIMRLLLNVGSEQLFWLTVIDYLEKINSFKYILGIDITIPDEYKDLKVTK
jgi:hypothetical protein